MISNVKCFGNCKALSTLGGNIIIRDLGVGEGCPSCAFLLPILIMKFTSSPKPSKAPLISHQHTEQTASLASF